VEEEFHAFLTFTLDGDEWLTSCWASTLKQDTTASLKIIIYSPFIITFSSTLYNLCSWGSVIKFTNRQRRAAIKLLNCQSANCMVVILKATIRIFVCLLCSFTHSVHVTVGLDIFKQITAISFQIHKFHNV